MTNRAIISLLAIVLLIMFVSPFIPEDAFLFRFAYITDQILFWRPFQEHTR